MNHRDVAVVIHLKVRGVNAEAATKVYGNIIQVSDRLVWGDRDWAKRGERQRDSQLIPQAETATVENGGHFLPLDQPGAVVEQIRDRFTVSGRT